MKLLAFIALLIFAFCKCNSKPDRSSGLTFTSCFGEISSGTIDQLCVPAELGDSTVNIIDKLNSSDEIIALNLIRDIYILDSLKYNGVKIFSPSNKPIYNYLIYRYQEYIGDVDKEKLVPYLLNMHNGNAIYDDDLSILIRIERSYISYFTTNKEDVKKNALDSLLNFLSLNPGSFRLRYLLSNIYFENKEYNKALAISRELINKNYYRYKNLRKIIEHYWFINKYDSCTKYITETMDFYPGKCIPEKMEVSLIQESELNILAECERCRKSASMADSIKSKVFLCRYYLKHQKFKKVDSVFSTYSVLNDELILDTLKIWERGEYYDIKLRAFFLQNRIREFCLFLFRDIGYNRKIKIENENDFYLLVKKYYKESYPQKSEKEFDSFFEKNFFPYAVKYLS
jgi:hypothetical protein